MDEQRASHQDIRPLHIAFCNLMPLKIVTETDFIRILSNTPLQIELDFFYMDKHDSKNTSKEHLNIFYKTFEQIKQKRYDGLIITGAPVEHLNLKKLITGKIFHRYWNGVKQMLQYTSYMLGSTGWLVSSLRHSEISPEAKAFRSILNTLFQIIKYLFSED